MRSRAAAARYARALFDVLVAERGDIERVERELSAMAELVGRHGQLARALTNPAIPPAKKHGVMRELIARAGGLQPPLSKLLLLLANRDRLVVLPDLAQAYRNRLMEHKRVVRAEVVTAVPLPADRVNAMRAGLARATGRQVHLETAVDPSILGGAVARVGSTVYDGSVTRQLERMREKLARAAE